MDDNPDPMDWEATHPPSDPHLYSGRTYMPGGWSFQAPAPANMFGRRGRGRESKEEKEYGFVPRAKRVCLSLIGLGLWAKESGYRAGAELTECTITKTRAIIQRYKTTSSSRRHRRAAYKARSFPPLRESPFLRALRAKEAPIQRLARVRARSTYAELRRRPNPFASIASPPPPFSLHSDSATIPTAQLSSYQEQDSDQPFWLEQQPNTPAATRQRHDEIPNPFSKKPILLPTLPASPDSDKASPSAGDPPGSSPNFPILKPDNLSPPQTAEGGTGSSCDQFAARTSYLSDHGRRSQDISLAQEGSRSAQAASRQSDPRRSTDLVQDPRRVQYPGLPSHGHPSRNPFLLQPSQEIFTREALTQPDRRHSSPEQPPSGEAMAESSAQSYHDDGLGELAGFGDLGLEPAARETPEKPVSPKAVRWGSEKTSRRTRAQIAREKFEREARAYKKLAPLDADWQARVLAALQHGHGSFQASDLRRVVPLSRVSGATDKWLNDEVVNEYLKLVVRHGNQNDRAGQVPSYHAFNSFFFSNLAEKGPESVRRWAQRAKISARSLLQTKAVFIPINQGAHWTLAVVGGEAKSITHYNSLGGNASRILDIIKSWVEAELGSAFKEEDWSLDEGQSPRQANMDDCGVFTVTSARQIMLGFTPMSYGAGDIGVQRMRIVAELVNGGLLKAAEDTAEMTGR